MAQKKRVFVSFDFDNDQNLKHLLVGQSQNKDVPFVFADWSMKEAAKQSQWRAEARARIRCCDIVIVLLGNDTHKAPGVLAEVEITRDEQVNIVQVRPQNSNATPVDGAGRLYLWTWDNLVKLLS
jgi:hypothetical protein